MTVVITALSRDYYFNFGYLYGLWKLRCSKHTDYTHTQNLHFFYFTSQPKGNVVLRTVCWYIHSVLTMH